jgi:hypothetical protein
MRLDDDGANGIVSTYGPNWAIRALVSQFAVVTAVNGLWPVYRPAGLRE